MERIVRETLANAPDYRTFLKIAIDTSSKGQAAFSRKAQLSSRSFIGEVLRGKRRLSHASLEKITRALNLSSDLRRLFLLLVALEETDVVSLGDKSVIQEKIASQRKKVLASNVSKKTVFLSHFVPIVYAALGKPETGASLQDVAARTELEISRIQEILDLLVNAGTVERKNDRYVAKEIDLDMDRMGDVEGFRRSFAQSLDALKKLALSAEPSDSRLFLYLAFSIPEKRMANFKRELQETILACVDKHQVEDGNKICRLSVGFHLGT